MKENVLKNWNFKINKKTKKEINPSDFMVVVPPSIVFHNVEIGKTYEVKF